MSPASHHLVRVDSPSWHEEVARLVVGLVFQVSNRDPPVPFEARASLLATVGPAGSAPSASSAFIGGLFLVPQFTGFSERWDLAYVPCSGPLGL